MCCPHIFSHGCVLYSGSLACTHTKWTHKCDFPAPDWPIAEFPMLKYPISEHEEYNARQEQLALESV